eukprot:GHRQ01026615.1.p2 GENE.GHRQ01026615.1~~GHRQ01026615.1.p2  ORF type:complete len:134 (+),score=39.99 GHRQ01026615.1:316-717(+)
MGILEKITEIEAEMARTQRNKATEYHLGQLKARLAKLRTELQAPSSKGGPGEGFDVQKYGDGRVALIGEQRQHSGKGRSSGSSSSSHWCLGSTGLLAPSAAAMGSCSCGSSYCNSGSCSHMLPTLGGPALSHT